MSSEVAMMLFTLVCSDPVPTFRQFYERWHGTFPGYPGEQIHLVQERVVTAGAHYIEYTVERRRKCDAELKP